ncbi:MAG: hypothetical protein V3S55_13970 [Nitrospiraceae bacterium]
MLFRCPRHGLVKPSPTKRNLLGGFRLLVCPLLGCGLSLEWNRGGRVRKHKPKREVRTMAKGKEVETRTAPGSSTGVVELKLDKDTKNTLRFQEASEEETGKRVSIGTLYVQKHVFGKPPWPNAVLVTVEW